MSNKLTSANKQIIRDEFVHGVMNQNNERQYPTLESLAKKHDVARATLYRHASSENWQSQKNQVQSEIQAVLDHERITKMISDGKRLDDSALQIAQGLLNKVGRTLQKAFATEQQNPNHEILSSSDLVHLSNVAANAQKVGKLALGQAQEISKVSADISSPQAFNEIMEQLDELADARSQGDSAPIH
jgi:hypothetical protein